MPDQLRLRVGTKLYGYCGDGDSYYDKWVEAIGADWVITRDEQGECHCHYGDPEQLLRNAVKEEPVK